MPEENQPTFEEAIKELEQVVAALESGSIGLEDSLAKYEEGIRLLRQCYQILNETEQKIEILTGFDQQGNPQFAPFKKKQHALEKPLEGEDEDAEDEQRLF